MKINRLHAIIGFLLVIIPFTGFTRGFKYGFAVFGGATILYFAMRSIHEEIMKKHNKHRRHDSFVENKPKDIHRVDSKVSKSVASGEIHIADSKPVDEHPSTSTTSNEPY